MATSKTSNIGFRASGFFVLRTPLVSFDELVAWSSGLESHAADDRSFVGMQTTLRERLREYVSRPAVQEALFLASPVLHAEIAKWSSKAAAPYAQKIERALVRYFTRMASRPTPFGVFSGYSIGTLGHETDIEMAPAEAHRRSTRLDGDYVQSLANELAQVPAVRAHLSFRPNSSLCMVAGRLSYAKRTAIDGDYVLVSVEPHDYIIETLQRAANGARLSELAAALVVADSDIDESEATEFVQELVTDQLLICDLVPRVTGGEPLDDLIAQLQRIPDASSLVAKLESARTSLKDLDAARIGAGTARYFALSEALTPIAEAPNPARMVQVDLLCTAQRATIGNEVVDEIARAVELIRRFTRKPAFDDPMAYFRRRFEERYGTREVPLLEVLDEDAGIGFGDSTAPNSDPSPLLAGVPFPSLVREQRAQFGPQEQHVLRLCERAAISGEQKVELTEEDLAALSVPDPSPLPDAFSVLAAVAAPSSAAFTTGEFSVRVGIVTGPSGATLLGRFCLGDPQLTRHVVDHLRHEEALRPHAVFAEVVHLPEGRIGNVICRPTLRDYEIPYLGRSGVAGNKQISASDLLVSVRGETVVLRSQVLDCEVEPRLSSAHNHAARGLSVYRFLCMLGRQHVGRLAWRLPSVEIGFVPRMYSGRVVLSLARWRLTQEELNDVCTSRGAKQVAAMQALRALRRLPRWIVMSEADNKLPIDLDNALAIEGFAHSMSNRDVIEVEELWPSPDQLFVRGPSGRFTHELVVPFVRTDSVPQPEQPRRVSQPSRVRRFAPGSDWAYAKLYCSEPSADAVLRGPIRQLVAALPAHASWHFVRYADPDAHLRFRVRADREWLWRNFVPLLHGELASDLSSGRIWKLQLDTYEREVERYGGPAGIELAERLFCVDSASCLELLVDPDAANIDERWHFALRGIHTTLIDLGLSLKERLALATDSRIQLGNEFAVDVAVKRSLGAKYRAVRDTVENVLRRTEHPHAVILSRRSAALTDVIAELKHAETRGALTMPIAELAKSFVHMHANRVLRSAHRAQELVLYDILQRSYDSEAAREKPGRS